MCSVTGTKPPSGPFTCQEKQPSLTTLEEKEEEKERNKQGGLEGGGGKGRWRETEAGGQREKKYKGRDEGSRCETDSLQSASRSRLEGQHNWTAP